MNYLTPQNIFDGASLLFIAVTAFAVYKNAVSKQKSNEDSDALVTIKIKDELNKQLIDERARLSNQVIQQGQDIAVLKAENSRLMKIVENRDPAFEKFMEDVSAGIRELLARSQPHNPQGAVVINNQGQK